MSKCQPELVRRFKIDGQETGYCSECSGTGYEGGEPKPGVGWCACRVRVEALIQRHLRRKRARVPLGYAGKTWDDYKVLGGADMEVAKAAYGAISTYRSRLLSGEVGGVGLYPWGECCTGKTMVACILAMELQDRGVDAVFYSMSEALSWYRKVWFSRDPFDPADLALDDGGIFVQPSDPKSCEVLILDDCFDPENTYFSSGGMQVTQLDDLLRHHLHSGHAVILTGNVDYNFIREKVSRKLASLLQRHVISVQMVGDFGPRIQAKLRKEVFGADR